MTLIDGDRIVTAQLYDDEYEEFKEEKMSIIDYINAYTDEGVTTADDVLDKIRAEIEQINPLDYPHDERTPERMIGKVLEIIDRYQAK